MAMELEALELAKKAAGGPTALARLLNAVDIQITKEAIVQWRRVPSGRVLAVERVTGVSRHDLRPDLYPREEAAE